MNDKFKRIMATGLLVGMIASMTSCDMPDYQEDNTNKNHGQTQVESNTNSETIYQTESETGQTNKPDDSMQNKLDGDVWRAVASRSDAHLSKLELKYLYDNIKYLPMPIKFLQDEGLLTYDSKGEMVFDGTPLRKLQYNPIKVTTAIDETSKSNDVYLIMQYSSQDIDGKNHKDAWVAVWKLKYTLDNEDYNAFLALEGDYRARLFIQEMDKIYEPEVVSKSVVTANLSKLVCPFDTPQEMNPMYPVYAYRPLFPKVYVSDIDYSTRTMTFALKKDDGYCYVDICIDNSSAMDTVINKHGTTKEVLIEDNRFDMDNKYTIVGQCLTSFGVEGLTSRYTKEESIQLYKNAETVDKLTSYNASSTRIQSEFDYDK